MNDTPLSETCVCGGPYWHVLIDRMLWCRRCGCARLVFELAWKVPLDRAGELPAKLVLADDVEEPTNPGTPAALQAMLDGDAPLDPKKS